MKTLKRTLSILIIIAVAAFVWQCENQPTKPEYDNPLDPDNPSGNPFTLTAEFGGGGVLLQWTTLNIPQIQRYVVFKSVNEADYDTLAVINNPATLEYVDTDIQNGYLYGYYLTVTDSLGNLISSNVQEVAVNSNPVISIEDDEGYTNSRQVNVTFIAYGATSVNIAAGGLMGTWQAFAAQKSVILEAGAGYKTVTVKFAYANGDTSDAVSDSTQPMPIEGNLVINNEGDVYTAERAVILYTTALSAKYMQVSNTPPGAVEWVPPDGLIGGLNGYQPRGNGIEGATDDWIAYNDTLAHYLELGEGMKVVYVQLKDDFDLTESLTDTIYPLPMEAEFNINRGAQYALTRQVYLYPSAQGAALTWLYSQDSNFPSPIWAPLSDSTLFTLNTGAGAKIVYGKFRNDFEITVTVQDTIFPTPMNPSVDISRGAQYAQNRNIWVYNYAVGGVQMMLSEDVSFTTASWVTFADSAQFTLSIGAGNKIVYAKYKNDFGEEQIVSDSIFPLPVTGSINIEHDAQYTSARDVWVYLQAEGEGLQVILSENADFGGASWSDYADSLEFTLSEGNAVKTVYAKFRNIFEIESAVYSDNIEPNPIGNTILINGGNQYTNSSLVDLSFPGEGALEYKFGESNNPGLYGWAEYTPQVNDFQLNTGTPFHTIYAWFRNEFFIAGPESASVTMDTECAIQSFTFTAGADTLEAGDIITFELSMEEDDIGYETGGSALVSLPGAFTDIAMSDNNDGTYTLSYNVQSDDYCIDEIPTLEFTDRAGNLDNASASAGLTIINMWQTSFGSTGDDFPYGVCQTNGGGYIIVGETNSSGAGGYDLWLVRLSADGVFLWEQTFGGASNDGGRDVIQTTDGGFLAVGYTSSEGAGQNDFYLVKINASGGEVWTNTFGGNGVDQCNSIVEASDGGYILCGTTSSSGAGNSDIWIMKIDENGSQVWARTNGTTNAEYGNDIAVDSDGGYVITGKVSLTTASYIKIVKVNSSGNEVWSNSYMGTMNSGGNGIILSGDGGYMIAANTVVGYPSGTVDMCLVKSSAAGAKLWDETFGGNMDDAGNSVAAMETGGYLVAGGIDGVYTLLKTDASGTEISRQSFGGTGSDQARCIINTSDGGYFAVGWVTQGTGYGVEGLAVKLSAGY